MTIIFFSLESENMRDLCIIAVLLFCFVSSQAKSPEVYFLHVSSEIDYRFAKTVVTSKVVNKEPTASEALFDLTLPNEAFITAFKLTINGKEIEGKVKEKEQAKQEFEAAKSKGQSAGHIVAKPRETNKFQIQVNVAATEKVTFELTYRELLKRTNGLYDHVIYINPGQVVDDLKINVLIKETTNITTIKTPPIRNDLLTDGSEGTNELAVVDRLSPTKAFVSYEPSRAEQESGISGQFIVQYDVDRSDDAGDLIFMDGYFVHFLAPEGVKPMPMDIVFVLDKSGSMGGTKMTQLQDSMKKILDDVKADDKIMIIAFDSYLSYWKTDFVQVTPENINNAKNYIRNTHAGGGTNIDLGLRDGIQKLTQISGNNGRAPVLVFLTDGEATVGETNTERILNNLKKENEADIPIFSLAFGRGADFDIVKRVAAQNNGFARKIYEDSDAALQIAGFYKEISTVLLKDVKFNYVDGTLYDTEVTNTEFKTYFRGSEMVVSGKVKDLKKLQSGLMVNGTGIGNQEVEFQVPPMRCIILPWPPIRPFPVPTTAPVVTTRNPSIMEKLWAYMTIKQLLKQKDALDSQTEIAKLDEKILRLSLKYQFVTPLTSMVVTLPDKTKANPSEVQSSDMNMDMGSFNGGMSLPQARGGISLSSSAFGVPNMAAPNVFAKRGPSRNRFLAASMQAFPAAPPMSNARVKSAQSNNFQSLNVNNFLPTNPPFTTITQPRFGTTTTTPIYTTTTQRPTSPTSPPPSPRKLEKSQVPSFGVTLPGLTKPLCFDLPMVSGKMYNLIDMSVPTTGYSLHGRFGTNMIERVTVFDEQSTSIDADPTDVTKAPVYQKRLGTTSVAVKNTPLGLQFLATFSKTRTNLNGVLAIWKEYGGKFVDIIMESGGFVTYIEITSTSGSQTVLKATTKEFGDGICWYLDNESVKRFYTNMSQFELSAP
ncbi:inter-alpha-trypsin inhibitor heavy chain H3-like isoform X3 [Crassostrea angulata]|uniref:inter-alpha-trypsin inhibitor heavy chain H3-like isoform X3 n=1 Tax=Magallana angulata TaxID=2784310 RepID=UPI0022B0BDBE|nr:inter-alpha-trypsin inhibitor heavy chain H3-like isoform X3 [Crassostrea angulata]